MGPLARGLGGVLAVNIEEARAPSPSVVAGTGLGLTALFVSGVLIAMATTTYDVWGGVLLAPILIGVTLPALRRQAAREGDQRLFWLLLLALLLKLAGSILRHYVAFEIYSGGADANHYHQMGLDISARFRSGDFNTGLPSLTGTQFIEFLTGIVYTIIGPTILGGFLVYSWLGFLGLFFFYRAFTLAVPEGRTRSYARLVFFLPSLLFWPSSIGKEAWITFTLGMAALGVAHALSGRTFKGLSMAAAALWLVAIVRPHIAALIALALAAGYLMRRPRAELGTLGPIAKVIGLVVVAVIALVFVGKANTFLKERGIDTQQGLTTALFQTSARTSQGGSQFVPSILESPTRIPNAVATVLFRPLISEAHNAQALAAGAEATFLFLLSLIRIRSILAALRSMRRQPYVAFAVANTGLMILALSSIANFGLLARERVQLIPLYLVLLAMPAPSTEDARRPAVA